VYPGADLERLVRWAFDVAGHDSFFVFASAFGVRVGVEAGVSSVWADWPAAGPLGSLPAIRGGGVLGAGLRGWSVPGVHAHQLDGARVGDPGSVIPFAPVALAGNGFDLGQLRIACLAHQLPGRIDDVGPLLRGIRLGWWKRLLYLEQ
jgi:hypothetical protein